MFQWNQIIFVLYRILTILTMPWLYLHPLSKGHIPKVTPPPPIPIDSGGGGYLCSGSPSSEPPIFRVLVTIDDTKNTPFPWVSLKSFRDYTPNPLCIPVGGGGGGIFAKRRVGCGYDFISWQLQNLCGRYWMYVPTFQLAWRRPRNSHENPVDATYTA